MNYGKLSAQLALLSVAHEGYPRILVIGVRQDIATAVRQQQDCFRRRVRLGVGDQIHANLRVDALGPLTPAERGRN